MFWSFTEFPDKERIELTKERDIAELYVGNKAWEITYKGAHPIEQKDLDDYLRRRRFSLDTVLRTWVNDPRVVLLFEGAAVAAQHPAQQVTLVNAQDESVTLYFDSDTHLPVKKSFSWRDPVDRQKNLEEEVYENYRPVSGVMAPYNLTRYFNGDMASQRFLNSVTINQGLDEAMFDPHSGYNPNKPAKQEQQALEPKLHLLAFATPLQRHEPELPLLITSDSQSLFCRIDLETEPYRIPRTVAILPQPVCRP